MIKVKISNLGTLNSEDIEKLKAELNDVKNAISEVDAEEKKLCSNKTELPTAKKDDNGELVRERSKLKQLYESTYKKRLEHRIVKPELKNLYDLKMNLFQLRLKVSRNIKSDNWSMDVLLQVLKKLKNNKSAHSHGLVYELFRPEIIVNNCCHHCSCFVIK